METLQTLERGLLALEQISQCNGELTVAQLAEKLKINRTIAYRIAWTLSQAGYIKINDRQGLQLSSKVINLYHAYEMTIPPMTQDVLIRLAEQTQGSAALVVAEGEECVVVQSVSASAQYFKVNYQLGSRHPIGVSAAGIAIAMTYPAHADEAEHIQQARKIGYGFSEGQFQTGARGYFMPLPHRHMAIGIVTFEQPELDKIVSALLEATHKMG